MDETRHIDGTKPIRDGEELDTTRLEQYLHEHLPHLDGPVSIEQFPRGHSNLTYLIRAGGVEMVLRRPPFGAKIKTAHDMGREYHILSGLHGVYPKVPRPLLHCEDASVIGAPFYLMQRVHGVILRGSRPPSALALTPELMRKLSTELVDNLAQLHSVDVASCGLADFGRPEGYVERQISGWTRRYQNAKTDELPLVEDAAAWLAANMPAESGVALIHGDFKYDNLVLNPDDLTDIIAVLDWEMATVGDPLMDLGTSLGYWVDPDDMDEARMLPLGPTLLEGNLSRRELVDRYGEKSGLNVENALFYFVYGLFKVCVIAQQIYRRFKDGHTQDPRFGMMIVGVDIIGKIAARAIDRGRIDRLG